MIIRRRYRGYGLTPDELRAIMAGSTGSAAQMAIKVEKKDPGMKTFTPVGPLRPEDLVPYKPPLEDHGEDPYADRDTGSDDDAMTAEEEGMSTGVKIAIGLGAAVVILGGAYAVSRR